MPITTKSLAFRLVAGAAFWVAAGLLVGGYLLSIFFREYAEELHKFHIDGLWQSLSESARFDQHDLIVLIGVPESSAFDEQFSGWYWQISKDGKVLRRSRSLWDSELKHPPVAKDYVWFFTNGPAGERLLVRAGTIQIGRRRQTGSGVVELEDKVPATIVVAGPVAQMEGHIEIFNSELVMALGGLGLVLVLAVFVQVRFGLTPLRRISTALAEIRSGRAEHLEGEFPSEVEPLADELNKLIEHNKAVVERARTHVGNLAHALKTPLAVLANESREAKGPLAKAVKEQSTVMQRQVEHHLARARAAARASPLGARTEIGPVLEGLKRTLLAINRDKNLAIDVALSDGAAVAGERQDVEEMLGNLLDNACKWAKGQVRVEVKPDGHGGRLTIRVEDDGPGLKPRQHETAIKRGARLDEETPGSGLGLAIVNDLAESYGGAFRLETAKLGGLAAVLELPAAAR